MGENLIKPYEISVWEDRLTQIEGSEEYKFTEIKIAVIGSNTMTGFNKVYDPVFNKKSNGEKTLTFSLKYRYDDPYTGQENIVNPFAALLVNERKVKLKYGKDEEGKDQWYEFIVKDHTKSSDELTWTYTCTDAFVLELSKNGYNIVFDSELGDNQGTAEQLGARVLEDTEWRVGEGDLLRQLVADPIYLGKAATNFQAYDTDNKITEEISAGTDLYVFYSYIKNKDGKFVQFIKQDKNEQYEIDDNNVIIATNYRILKENLTVTDTEIKDEEDTVLITLGEIETKYQANRLVYKQRNIYDPVMQRVVDIYKVNDQEIYKYTDYTYTTSNVVMNFITNGENFNVLEDGTLQGWNPYVDFTKQSADDKIDKLELVTKPEISTAKELVDLISLSQVEGFMKVKFKGPLTNKKENAVFNSGIENNTSFIESIAQGDKFIFRWRAGQGELDSLAPATDLRLLVASFTRDDPNPYTYYYRHIESDNIILDFDVEDEPQELNNYVRGGRLVEEQKEQDGQLVGNKVYNYVIDNIVQIPSTKYIYMSVDPEHPEDEEIEYIWDGTTSKFIKRTDPEANYLPYYYLTATATKPISNTDLTDPNKHFGIFIYTKNGTSPIYIQDIQLTRFVADSSDEEGETPILIGNVPTATTNSKDYYYLKPRDGMTANDIIEYASLDGIAKELNVESNTIVPVYNEDCEKFLSINESQSNCFNLLQTIAETFECWVDLVVDHDDRGYITEDEEGNLNKFVYFREYAGKDNWAGFKYGINLESIERDVNSDEIVTKLIVDLSQSDYTDEGFVTIANAPSNPSGEAYILNFDYYYSQGLLDKEAAEKDRINFIKALAEENIALREKEKRRNDLEAALVRIGSNRNTYTTLVTSAEDLLTEGLGDFQNLTNRSYQEYQKLQKDADIYEDKYYIETKDTEVISNKKYYEKITQEGTDTFKEIIDIDPEIDPSGVPYYELLLDLTKEETILDIIGQLYINSATINNYSGYVSNVEQEYWNIRRELRGSEDYSVTVWTEEDDNQQRHLYVELNDYLPGFSFKINNSDSIYYSTVNKKFFDIITDSTIITFTAPNGFTIDPAQYTIEDEEATPTFEIKANEVKDGVEDEIKKIQERKDELTKAFNAKYRRFIQEGTWNSSDYIDSEMYYLDALQTSITSSRPVVSYTINVVEISELDGFEWYLFDAGDKTYIEDTEFFGWTKKNDILTPAREEVIVSEVEWHLDEPDKNVITVQNYKTRFEDLFQRINATVQTVEYNEATYAKMSTLLDAKGTINQDVLIDSLNKLTGAQYNLVSDGSIVIKDDNILIQNLNNAANRVIINSEGIRVSSDGGNTWVTAVDGKGLNLNTAYTGKLNTDEIIIGNKDNPSFRWDKAGISAFKSNGEDAYDLQTYVRYDQYGLYGIKDGETFKAQSLSEVIDKAHFAVTWDGFFIKNSYEGGGKVEITSDNDFRVLSDPTNQGNLQEKIKIGALEWGDGITSPDAAGATKLPTLYGIRIKNDDGDDVFKTGDNGNLEITGAIYATEGHIGGLDVFRDWMKMKYIVFEPEVGIYSTYPNEKQPTRSRSANTISTYPFLISDTDGSATFNNVSVRGSIKTSVFEYEEIQAVGGAFMFRPSTSIKTASTADNVIYDENTGHYSGDLIITVDKPLIVRNGAWYKLSNYNSDSTVTADELSTYGLVHIYQLSKTTINDETEIRLINAAAILDTININDIAGGSIIDMGYEAGHIDYANGTKNYGIGINSSDNYVNLPPRAISLFETVVDHLKDPKVTYNYRGILGTLPPMNSGVDASIYQNMQNTQGIYTDNMYIGDAGQFIAFYEDENGNKQLKIKANQIVYEVTDPEPGQNPWQDIADIAAEGVPGPAGPAGEDAITVRIESSAGEVFLNKQITTTLTCTVIKGGNTDITNQVTRFNWIKKNADGTVDTSWSRPLAGNTIVISEADVTSKAIFICEVEF